MKTTENDGAEAIRLTALTKEYRRGDVRFKALNAVDLRVRRGEFVAIMGASGSGKSTLLHCVAGLTRPTSGEIEIDGRRLAAMKDREITLFRRRKIGVVFQSYNLIPHLTAEENILLPLRADGRKIDAATLEKMRAAWKTLEIEPFLNAFPDSLSGGQRQRVALARAVAVEPTALLADEPTGNLDWTAGRNICREFDRMNRESNLTILLVTHEPAVAVWASRVVILRDGAICDDFPRAEIADAAALAARYQRVSRGGEE
ncbi:MAG: ABC transporter ATP-binding protein [Thermoguttaceae bacterium]|nr:ABC transporter ATP-binding protein [Thermoguttaceae bacterium]